MFKGFQNKSRQFNGFPNLNFQVNNEAYGFSGCTFWLDAAYGLNTQTDLAAVSSWQTKIGGITFTQSTAANQPRFVLSNALYNSLPTVQTISGTRYMVSNLGANINTIAFIANYDVLDGASLNTLFGNQSVVQAIFMGGGGSAAITGVGYRSGSSTYASGTTENTNVKIVVMNGVNIYVNGTSEYTGSYPLNQYVLNNLFASQNSRGLYGSAAEIIGYNFIMTNDQMLQLSNILNSKYAIY